ncbi:MAG: MazG family protein [Chloroflexi bacterium]|nr:MazG family protein [Chloroflexota bacterium]
MPRPASDGPRTFEELLGIVEQLRDSEGCPWDRVQTHVSLRQHLLEECYEALEAIDAADSPGLAEELGDLLVHIAFHADIARRAGEWTAADLIEQTSKKLIRRHPHVFSEGPKMATAADVLEQWEGLKRAERGAKRITDSVPAALPALALAAALQKKSEAAGLNWRLTRVRTPAIGKPRLQEINNASTDAEKERLAGETLFEAVAELKDAGVDPETALRAATLRFRRQLKDVEELAGDSPISDLPPGELARLWRKSEPAGSEPRL